MAARKPGRSAAHAYSPVGVRVMMPTWCSWWMSCVSTILSRTAMAASSGDFPLRMFSTARNAPHTAMTSSPSPVATAAPCFGSTYKPCPMMGESPTRPGTL